jgi:DNA-binding CsgD family transcriptional regulator
MPAGQRHYPRQRSELSHAQLEIAELLLKGYTLKEVAYYMPRPKPLSVKTIETQVALMKEKLQARTLHHLAVLLERQRAAQQQQGAAS